MGNKDEDRENQDASFETVFVDPMRNSAVTAGSQDMRYAF